MTSQRTPQGGSLSPFLSNIYLTSFDRILESRAHKFVRYADDCNIYVKSVRVATLVMGSCVSYLKGKLKLKVNQEKSKVDSPLRSKLLGFSLYKVDEKVGIRPHANAIQRFKQRIQKQLRTIPRDHMQSCFMHLGQDLIRG